MRLAGGPWALPSSFPSGEAGCTGERGGSQALQRSFSRQNRARFRSEFPRVSRPDEASPGRRIVAIRAGCASVSGRDFHGPENGEQRRVNGKQMRSGRCRGWRARAAEDPPSGSAQVRGSEKEHRLDPWISPGPMGLTHRSTREGCLRRAPGARCWNRAAVPPPGAARRAR